MKYIIVLLFSLMASVIMAQVTIVEDAAVKQMIDNYKAKHRAETTMKGYKIQIITTPDRRKMEHNKAKFARLYPHIKMEWNHISPYYNVRVGAYQNKMDLMGFMIDLKRDFKDAIPVVSDIEKYELISY